MGKIIESRKLENLEVWTEDGWKPLTHVHKTVPYDVYELVTESHVLKCADEHIVILDDNTQCFVRDLTPNNHVLVDGGVERVISVTKLDMPPTEMYDVTVDSDNHTFFTNGILSHNTTMSTVFLLYYMLFNKDKVIAVLANKESAAQEILRRIKTAYTMLPLWLQQGIKVWNETSLELENGMRLISATTSSDSISGETVSLLYLDEFAKVKPHVAEEFITATLPVVSSGKTSKVIIVSCVVGDTFILTPNGLAEMIDFVDCDIEPNPLLGYTVSPYKVMGHGGFKDGSVIVNSGIADTKVIVSTSAMIETSWKHPFYVCDNGTYCWKKASELTGEEYIAIEYGHDVWGTDDTIPYIDIGSKYYKNDYRFNVITEDFAYLIGLYLSEGSVRSVINDGQREYTQMVITCGDFVGGILDKLGIKYSCNDGIHYVISSYLLCDVFQSLGFDLSKKAHQKEIPKRLFSMSRKNVIAMIQGMMDGDGSAHGGRGTIHLQLSSERMIKQFRALLANFGILCEYRFGTTPPTERVKVSSDFYRIDISRGMSKKYYDIIGFRFERKQCRESILPDSITRNSHDIIPYSKDVIVSLKQSHPNDYKKIVDSGIMKGNYKKTPHFNRDFMLRHKEFMLSLNNEKINSLYALISESVKFEKIKTITDSKSTVYDFSLSDTDDCWCHSVLYNNVLCHQTPLGLNHFYQYWQNATRTDGKANNFYPIKVNWWDHPDRDEAWRLETLQTMNNNVARFNQEFNCRFLGSASTLIDPEVLERTLTTPPLDVKWNGLCRIYEFPKRGSTYVLGIDTSGGGGGGADSSVVQVLRIDSATHLEQVAVYSSNSTPYQDFAQVCIGLSRYYNTAEMMIENNGIGETLAHTIWYDYEYDHIVNCDKKGLGIRSTTKSKMKANLLLKQYIDNGMLILHDDETLQELSRYIEVRPGVYKAETTGAHDDCVTSLLWGLYFITTDYFDGKVDSRDFDDEYDLGGSFDGPIMFVPDDYGANSPHWSNQWRHSTY